MAWYKTLRCEYASGLTDERTQREVDFINSTLNLPQATGGGRILDLCCGHGRHTVELAAAGYSMVRTSQPPSSILRKMLPHDLQNSSMPI